MKPGFVGPGRKGFNMVQRLQEKGHSVVAYNRNQAKVEEIKQHGALGATSLQDLVNQLTESPKPVWLMVPN